MSHSLRLKFCPKSVRLKLCRLPRRYILKSSTDICKDFRTYPWGQEQAEQRTYFLNSLKEFSVYAFYKTGLISLNFKKPFKIIEWCLQPWRAAEIILYVLQRQQPAFLRQRCVMVSTVHKQWQLSVLPTVCALLRHECFTFRKKIDVDTDNRDNFE